MDACCDCHSTTAQLRPYGPGGKPICNPCAMKPERFAEAKRRMEAACEAAIAQADADGSGLALSTGNGAPTTKAVAEKRGDAFVTVEEYACVIGAAGEA
jgi:hypothetical protein